MRSVRAAPGSNTVPAFPDQDTSTPDVEKEQEREVEENTPAGRNIGDPVAANDAGDVLAYSLSGDDAAMFDIDIATGQLKTKGKLDRDPTGGDEHEVTVTAVDPFGTTDMAMVTIEVTNVDEAPAIGAAAKAVIMHPEPVPAPDNNNVVPAPVVLETYTATDDEDDVNPTTARAWSLKGADEDLLTIDANGMLMFMSNPDFEKAGDAGENNVYNVTVVATDSDDLTDELAVRIEVTNVNEAGVVTFLVNEPRTGVPVTAMLEDPDGGEAGHEWQWMVADDAGAADDAKTEIEDATSATYTPRDEDMDKFLSVKVEYTDGKGEDEAEYELAVAVAEAAAPRFYDSVVEETRKTITEFEIELPENTVDDKVEKMEPIYVDHRTDDVATVLRYAVSGTDMASFEIVTGVASSQEVNLKATGQLDHEDKASYSVTVTATDSDGLSASLPVTIKVTEVDEKPELSGSGTGCEENMDGDGYDCEYAENDMRAVATFTAEDPEGKAIEWDVTGADAAVFDITGGVLTFKTSPNYEASADAGNDNTYEVTVRAADAATDGNTSERMVAVEVTNVDEDGTVAITVNGATTGQPVLQPQVGTELTASLSDEDVVPADINDDPNPEWQWYRGSTEISGATNAAYEPVEADVGNRLTAKATYIDNEDDANEKEAEARTLRSVRAAPGSNTVPAFPDQDTSTPDVEKEQEREVEENTPAGRNIGDPVAANDAGDVLAYSLSGDDAAMFDIDIATGQLKTKGKLDRDPTGGDEHEVTVTAVDPFGTTDMAMVTIEVTNVDEAPAIGAAAKAVIMHPEPVPAPDNNNVVPAPVVLETYTATDDEDDVNPTTARAWSLKGADEDLLTIDANGMLMFMSNPDFEKAGDAGENNVYNVTVVATDSDDLTDELAVRIEVTNVNEAGVVTFSVNEPRTGVPVTAMLEDPDGGEAGHEWQWMVADDAGAADDAKTEIEDATSATYTPRDEDMDKFLSVKVEYTDGKGEDEAEYELAVAVAEAAAPRFYDSVVEETRKTITEFEIELPENTVDDKVEKMEPIYVDHRTDDVATVLRYAVSGTDMASFEIVTGVASSQEVNLKATGQLDHEDKASYSVTVTATDSDGLSASLPVTIKVTEVDEKPVISRGGLVINGRSSRSYAENGTGAVETYTASGPDAASATWTLGGDDAGDFEISSSGELAFRSVPDYENPTDMGGDNVYQVTVKAADGTYMDTHDVTVTVTEMEDDVVTPGDSVVDMYDDNDSGRIDKDELVEAILDYNINQTLSKADLVELILSYEIG